MKLPWLFEGHPFTSDMIGEYIGFVYQITNLDNGKKYIEGHPKLPWEVAANKAESKVS